MTENTSRPGEDRRPHNQHSALANALGDTIANDMRQAAMTNAALAGNIEDHDHNIIDGILRRASKAKNKLADIIGGRVSRPETQQKPKSTVTSYLDSLDPERRQEELRTVRNTRRTSLDFDIRPGRAGTEGDQMILPFTHDTPASVGRKAGTGRLPRTESKSRLDTLKYIIEIANKPMNTKKPKEKPYNVSGKNTLDDMMYFHIGKVNGALGMPGPNQVRDESDLKNHHHDLIKTWHGHFLNDAKENLDYTPKNPDESYKTFYNKVINRLQ